MDTLRNVYVSLAIAIWSAVGGLVGYAAGLLLSLGGREMVFPVVLGVGVVWLLAIRLLLWPTHFPRALLNPGNVRSDGPLSSTEARVWLDAFVMDQQTKREKK